MEGMEEGQQKGSLAALTRNDWELRPAIDGWDTGFHRGGSQPLERPMRKELFGSASMTVLRITLISLATVYLLLSCFRHLSVGYRLGGAPRSLAVGGDDRGAPCRGDSDDKADDSEEPGEGSSTAGVPVPGHGTPEAIGGSPPAQQPAVGPPEEVEKDVYPPGMLPAMMSEDEEQPQILFEEGWGERQMPRSKMNLVHSLLIRLRNTAAMCDAKLSLLGPNDAFSVVNIVTSLAAVELAAFSAAPLELEPARKQTVEAFRNLLCNARKLLSQKRIAPKMLERLDNLGALMGQIKRTRQETAAVGSLRYMKKMMGCIRMSYAAFRQLIASLDRLWPPTGQSPTPERVTQELQLLKTVLKLRKRHFLMDRYMRYWLAVGQKVLNKWIVFNHEDIQAARDSERYVSSLQPILEMDEAAARVLQPKAELEGEGNHGQGQGAAGHITLPQMDEDEWPSLPSKGRAATWLDETPSSAGDAQGAASAAPGDHHLPLGELWQATPPGPQAAGGFLGPAADASTQQEVSGLDLSAKPDDGEDSATHPLIEKLFEWGLSWDEVFSADDEDGK